jgi:hypothetical protein
VLGSSKYRQTGGISANSLASLELPEEVRASIADLGNLGVASGTWRSYTAGQKLLDSCEKETGHNVPLPLSETDILFFIDWLHRIRKLSSGTIRCYLSGLRQLHISRGMTPPNFRTPLVKLILKGIYNREGIQKRGNKKVVRQPITLNMLLILKTLISRLDMHQTDRSLIWAVCTMAFAGAFRIHELLSKTESVYDPAQTLLAQDITQSSNKDSTITLHISLKSPKETKNHTATVVDVYQSGSDTCPVTAFTRWQAASRQEAKYPVFCWKSGSPLTGSKFNSLIKYMLAPYIDETKGKFVSHSFRIGLASMLGTLGYGDEDIKAAGRWSSRAFQTYLKLTRNKRANIGKQICNIAKQHK